MCTRRFEGNHSPHSSVPFCFIFGVGDLRLTWGEEDMGEAGKRMRKGKWDLSHRKDFNTGKY